MTFERNANNKVVKRCITQMTTSSITWCIILWNSLIFLYQVQASWLKRNLGREKSKFLPDLWVTPRKYSAAIQFCKTRIIGYPSSLALERPLHCLSVVRCTGEKPAVEQRGREDPISPYTNLLFPVWSWGFQERRWPVLCRKFSKSLNTKWHYKVQEKYTVIIHVSALIICIILSQCISSLFQGVSSKQ